MAINKKIRFEIFKRDGFMCGYCGKTPPAVVLEIDHVIAISNNGDDDINNLLTSCFDCNRGKSNIPLDKIPSALSDNLEVLQEKEKQIAAYNHFRAKVKKREDLAIARVVNIYDQATPGFTLTEQFKQGSLRNFIRNLHVDDVCEAMHIALNRFKNDRALRYFCGICWVKIRKNGNQ